MFQKLQSIFERAFRQKEEKLRLEVSADEVTLFSDDREVWQFRWDAVTRIDTYKRDLLTTDMICLDFFVGSRQLTYPVHDEMQGFGVVCAQLRRHFPSVEEDWLPQVTLPPFATNHKVLYEQTAA